MPAELPGWCRGEGQGNGEFAAGPLTSLKAVALGGQADEGSGQHPWVPLPRSPCTQPAPLLGLLALPPSEVPTGGSRSLSGYPHMTGNLCHSCHRR